MSSVNPRTRASGLGGNRKWDVGIPVELEQEVCAPGGNGKSGDRPQDREQHALDQELLDDAPARGPEREADRHLTLSRACAREEEIRDVRAGDQQHARDDGRQHQERRGQLPPEIGPAVASLRDRDRAFQEVVPGGRRGLRERRLSNLHLQLRGVEGLESGSGLFRRDARTQPRKDVEPARAAIRNAFRQRRQAARHHHRHEDLRRLALVDAVEALLRDAHDRHRQIADDERLADDGRIARKAALPVGMAQHRQRVAVGSLVLVGAEGASQMWTHAEHREVRARDQLALDPFGRAAEGHVERVAPPAEHADKDLVVIAEVGVPRIGQLVAVPPAVAILRALCGDDHELLGLPDRQQAKQHLVDEREHRCVRANAQRDRKDGDCGDDRGLAQAAPRVAKVGQHVRHHAWVSTAVWTGRRARGLQTLLPAAAMSAQAYLRLNTRPIRLNSSSMALRVRSSHEMSCRSHVSCGVSSSRLKYST